MLVGYIRGGKCREKQKEKLRGNERSGRAREYKRRREKKWQEDGVMCYCGACSRRSDPSGR